MVDGVSANLRLWDGFLYRVNSGRFLFLRGGPLIPRFWAEVPEVLQHRSRGNRTGGWKDLRHSHRDVVLHGGAVFLPGKVPKQGG